MRYDVIVLAYRGNLWAVDPFYHFASKHWPGQQVTLVAEENPAGVAHKFLPIPPEMITSGTCPPKKFSDSLIYALGQTRAPYVIIMLADYWLCGPVAMDRLDASMDYMDAHQEVLRVDIGSHSLPRAISDLSVVSHPWLLECKAIRDCFLPTSLCPALWNKSQYLSILAPDWDPWMTELLARNTYLGKRADLRSLWIHQGPINYVNVLRGRDPRSIVLRERMYEEALPFLPKGTRVGFCDNNARIEVVD